MKQVALFKNKLSDISLNFTVYRKLFDDKDAVNTMNNFHSLVFGNYQKCLVDTLYLEIAKLFDRGTNQQNINLSFQYLISRTVGKFHPELNMDFQKLKSLFEASNLKTYRNKLLAHNDLKTIINSKVARPVVTGEALKVIVDEAWALFGKIEHYLGITDRTYVTSSEIRLPTGSGIDEFILMLQKRI
jgi:hypothetical protein